MEHFHLSPNENILSIRYLFYTTQVNSINFRTIKEFCEQSFTKIPINTGTVAFFAIAPPCVCLMIPFSQWAHWVLAIGPSRVSLQWKIPLLNL